GSTWSRRAAPWPSCGRRSDMQRARAFMAQWKIAAAVAALVGMTAWGCGSSQKTGNTAGGDQAGASAAATPVLLPVPSDPTVSYAVWFQVGSQNDPPGKEGLAWLTGRLVA